MTNTAKNSSMQITIFATFGLPSDPNDNHFRLIVNQGTQLFSRQRLRAVSFVKQRSTAACNNCYCFAITSAHNNVSLKPICFIV